MSSFTNRWKYWSTIGMQNARKASINLNVGSKFWLTASAVSTSVITAASIAGITPTTTENNFTNISNDSHNNFSKIKSNRKDLYDWNNASPFSKSRDTNDMNTIIIGSGEYVTGFTGTEAVGSDKSMGVVGLVFFDLRQRGLVGQKIAICGTNGDKFKGIRNHWNNTAKKIFYNSFGNNNKNNKTNNKTNNNNKDKMSFEQYPNEGIKNIYAYKECIREFSKAGDICIIFTPDDTHFEICEYAIDHGLHVLCTKPFVKTLKEHIYLVEKAKKKNVLLQIEVHKRFDALYNDAINRIKDNNSGKFNYFISYMSQPIKQLNTFKQWAGKSSDISYYLNSHHIDLHVSSMINKAKCIYVTSMATNNVIANKMFNDNRNCEDTITISALWQNFDNKKNQKNKNKNEKNEKKENNNKKSDLISKSESYGHALYTSSWTAMESDVHSQQRFFCLMENNEINIDQAHRGYTLATQENKKLQSINPLFIRNTPDSEGNYVCQDCYGYKSFEHFVKAAKLINDGIKTPQEFDNILPTGNSTKMVTAILEAGRISLDNDGKRVKLIYDDNDQVCDLQLAD